MNPNLEEAQEALYNSSVQNRAWQPLCAPWMPHASPGGRIDARGRAGSGKQAKRAAADALGTIGRSSGVRPTRSDGGDVSDDVVCSIRAGMDARANESRRGRDAAQRARRTIRL